MNSTIKSRTAGASILLAVLLGSAACGTETVENSPGTQPGIEARIYPPVSVPSAPVGKASPGRVSADAAERQAAQEKARQDSASTARWARGSQIENKLQLRRNPERP